MKEDERKKKRYGTEGKRRSLIEKTQSGASPSPAEAQAMRRVSMWCPDGAMTVLAMVVVVVDAAAAVVAAAAGKASVVLLWRPGRRSPVNVFLSDGR